MSRPLFVEVQAKNHAPGRGTPTRDAMLLSLGYVFVGGEGRGYAVANGVAELPVRVNPDVSTGVDAGNLSGHGDVGIDMAKLVQGYVSFQEAAVGLEANVDEGARGGEFGDFLGLEVPNQGVLQVRLALETPPLRVTP